MDNVGIIIFIVVLVITVPIFYLIAVNRKKMENQPDRNFDPNHRKRRRKKRKWVCFRIAWGKEVQSS